ncbi:bis(5'-nucleosyl)-tetraphosphatase PrpE [Virgibacillus flavescens]|uniref:bis(5'-nucleosyl)-tetraphosphatase PrpE n=1 Tax=Virgibacillus flavescens TaxID=1611422 RepID=UPI003D3296AC
MKIDVIGDVHGCIDELIELFYVMGYEKKAGIFVHPKNRVPVFVGDITDRGPDSLAVVELVYNMVVKHRAARYVPGNHCNKLYRYLLGNDIQIRYGLETTVEEYLALTERDQKKIKHMFMTLYEEAPLYLHLTEIDTLIAHAGIKESFIGRTDKRVRTFVLYGDITGTFHEDGRPIRRDWAQNYHGKTWIIYGHTPVLEPRQVNNTINIDTGCVFGNKLTAFRFPEQKTISVQSRMPFVSEKFSNL